MENVIHHDGIIESISNGRARVRILQAAACGGCQIASRCHTAEAKEKIVDVDIASDSRQWQEGQSVVVSTQGTMAGRALLIGFGLPLLLMLAVLAACLAAHCSEGLTALLMLLSLVPYYIGVWMFRGSISRKITFFLETTDK